VAEIRSKRLTILLEMRAALNGYAGIPQETRLLFRGLSTMAGVSVAGLLQHPTRVLPQGLSTSKGRWFGRHTRDEQVNRLGRVVIALEQRYWDSKPRAYLYSTAMSLWHLIGGRQHLTRFEGLHFRDYLWRRFFAQTLPPEDFDVVTRGDFRIAREPWNGMQIGAVVVRKIGWPSLFPRLDTADFDVMISETPYPASVSKRTKLIVRYHDAIPMTMPHTISDKRWHHEFHYHALRKNVADGAWFVCVSEATRRDLLSVFPQAEARSLTIHNMVSHDYFVEDSTARRIPQVIRTRLNPGIDPPLDSSLTQMLFAEDSRSETLEYLLIVSTIEPRKNHETLLAAWEKMRSEHFPALKLLIVGKLGWHHDAIVSKVRPWMERGDVFFLEGVPSSDLRLLYKHARATVCPSFGEGFDFSGVEAMRSGGAVVASDIPVHREIYDDAAEYCNPYSAEDVSRAIVNVIDRDNSARRDELIAKGAVVAQRYLYEAILPKWAAFLNSGNG
jgi:glycosyltransferase involved in cell wall biosynthesis